METSAPTPTVEPTPLPTVTVTPEPVPAPSADPAVSDHLAHIAANTDTLVVVAVAVGLTLVFCLIVLMVRALR